MTQAQRLIAILTCLTMAFVMHTLTCEWHIRAVEPPLTFIVILHTQDSTQISGYDGRPLPEITGLAIQHRTADNDKSVAVVVGITLPLMLVGVAAILAAGWRRGSRKARGLCVRCGYPVTGETCSECGLAT